MSGFTMDSMTKDQQLAIKKMTLWYNLIENQQYYRLVGYAGTGKTTLVNLFIKEIGLDPVSQVAFCAFTGSAAMNLVKKGNKRATTIHQLIYDTAIEEVPVYKRKKNKETGKYEPTNEILKYEKRFYTTKKSSLNEMIKLIVIDEFSMASDEILNDVLSFGIKVLMIGDSGQLPPIRKINTYMDEYDSILEEIVRQKGDSAIVDLSFNARNKIAIPYGRYGDAEVWPETIIEDEDEAFQFYNWADQILCGTNKTRKNINRIIRKHKGFTSKLPERGDKIICTQNNWSLAAWSPKLGSYINLVNGTMGYVLKVKAVSEISKAFIIDFATDFDPDCIFEDLKISFYNFDERVEIAPSNRGKSGKDVDNIFDFGYCMTVHKAQGNGYPKVLIVAERMSFGRTIDIENERRWLYTAITRAENQLIMIVDQKYYRNSGYKKDSEYWNSINEVY